MSKSLQHDRRYMALIRRFPLRPIRTLREQKAAMAVVSELAVRDEQALARGESDYLDALTVLLEDYDRRQAAPSDLSEVDLLKHLTEEHALSTSDLGRIIGSQTTASLILAGKRSMSKTVMLKLAQHFGVNPGLFLMASDTEKAA